MRTARFGLILLVLALMSVQALRVNGQSNTTITNLTYPTSHVTNGVAEVTFDLAYSGVSLMQRQVLVAVIWDRDTDIYLDGSASSTPDPCLNLETVPQLNGKAVCAWLLASSSGSEHLTFDLQLTTDVHSYTLAAAAGVVSITSQAQTSIESMTSSSFTIKTGMQVMLSVTAPNPVPVTIDGAQAGTGVVSQEVDSGSHQISVPEVVNIDNVTRLKFRQWDDGSTNPQRSIDLNSDTSYTASYVTQYKLILVSNPVVNATGSGWYDANSTAEISAPSTLPVNGFLGTLGAKLQFAGWSENGQVTLPSSTGTIKMNAAHALVAEWTTDYTMPIIIIVIILACVGAIGFVAIRKKSK